ncbi:hypothetical protein AS9A_P20030 (plasmid) [Hoyosella subflava DQS3-9A1]|uniref:ATPase AAA-type core domain-containing protein n=2 Tax=Hoyosella TaxID=697025 RepID=F6ESF3_HOYSD|nr:hypothetical protein AS9A_P20030 [Hoyosella subflava DQS3-9A1]
MGLISSLEVGGLRGFADSQRSEFAIPDGKPGSGLTVLLGANNSGKSTVIEALRAVTRRQNSSFAASKRNQAFGDRVDLKLTLPSGVGSHLVSVEPSSSETRWEYGGGRGDHTYQAMFVQSRRGFDPMFGRTDIMARHSYLLNESEHRRRPQQLDSMFASRLFKIVGDPEAKTKFDELLAKVVVPCPNWTIDLADSDHYFIKFLLSGGASHTSDGVGEGIISLFSILDALYDSDDQDIIVIDEPELSLHPQLQKRLRTVLSEHATTRQIIYTTHSPYLIDWSDIENGARIARVYKNENGAVQIRQATPETLREVCRLGSDTNNPHALGLAANEVFFLEDGVILTEGQEDVVFFEKKIDKALGMRMEGSFFGWGVGGAEKMDMIMQMLSELGFRRVVAVFDGDKSATAARIREAFPGYHIAVLPADDIRTKPARKATSEKLGLWHDNQIDPQLRPRVEEMYKGVNEYLSG